MLSPDTQGWEPDPGQVDRFGREIPAGRYSTRDFERVVRLLMRTDLAARYLSDHLRRDHTAKMMVFCVDTQHAEDMRQALVMANPARVAADPEWVVRIVGEEGERARLLENFADPERSSPVVATTSRMLSTGIDVEDLKYVVLFRPVGSAVEFKQIIGRGTRLYPDKGKTSFEIIDFVGATSHFADPDFDGYPARIVVDPGPKLGTPAPTMGRQAGSTIRRALDRRSLSPSRPSTRRTRRWGVTTGRATRRCPSGRRGSSSTRAPSSTWPRRCRSRTPPPEEWC